VPERRRTIVCPPQRASSEGIELVKRLGYDAGLRRAVEALVGESAVDSSSGPGSPSASQWLPLDPATIDELAVRISDAVAGRIIEVIQAEQISPQLSSTAGWLDAHQVARRLGVSREWVYQHADELGCIRLGGGACPRLRFDPKMIRERLPSVGEPPPPRPRPVDRSSSRRARASRTGERRV
jgi:hypothetical protein